MPAPIWILEGNPGDLYRGYVVSWTGGTIPDNSAAQSLAGITSDGFLVEITTMEAAHPMGWVTSDGFLYSDDADGPVYATSPVTLSEGRYILIVCSYANHSWLPVLPAGMSFVDLTTQAKAKLHKVGFSVRGTETLQAAVSDPETVDWKSALRRGDLSRRQMKTLEGLSTQSTGLSDLAYLLKGGFTRHQAKLILLETV